MENELIIDGQVIDLSETQENAEETIIQTESQPENESQDDNGKEVATEPEKTEETPEDYALRIGDEEIQLNADDDDHIDGQPAPQWVKDLRKGFKETQKENRELRRQLEEALAKPAEHQQPQPDAIPPKPTLESCDYDEAIQHCVICAFAKMPLLTVRFLNSYLPAQQRIKTLRSFDRVRQLTWITLRRSQDGLMQWQTLSDETRSLMSLKPSG